MQLIDSGHSVDRIREAVGRKKIVFIAIPASSYKDWLLKITEVVYRESGRVGYMALVWSPKLVRQDIRDYNRDVGAKINLNKLFFIDGSTQGVQKWDKPWLRETLEAVLNPGRILESLRQDNVLNVRESLTDKQRLADDVINYLNENQVKSLLVDTLAILPIHLEDNMRVLQLAHSLIRKLVENGITGVFPFPNDKQSIELGKDLQWFADTVILV